MAKNKKLKESEIIYKTLGKEDKAYLREVRITLQSYRHTNVPKYIGVDFGNIDIIPLNMLSSWRLKDEIEKINKHELQQDDTFIGYNLRLFTHLYLISKTTHHKRVRYCKDLSVWENIRVRNELEKILKDYNNCINMSMLDIYLYNSEIEIFNITDLQIQEESKDVIEKISDAYIQQVEIESGKMLQDYLGNNEDKIANFICAYINENINIDKINKAFGDMFVKHYKENLVYFSTELAEMLISHLNDIINQMEVDEGIEHEETSTPFVSMSWRDLESLALKKGFVYIRSNGDHGIYKTQDKKFLIIPRGRTIGKGLQIAILKQIDGKA